MSSIARYVTAVTLLFLAGRELEAQRGGLREIGVGSAWHLGFAVAEPVGQFARFVGVHPGLEAAFTSGGPVGVRLEGSMLVYGSTRYLVPAGWGYAYAYKTDNLISSLGVGPQLTLGRGALRLYGYGTVGVGYFATVTSADGCGCGYTTTEYDDVAFARTAGAGLQIALSRRRPWFLDLSARYIRHGRVSYLSGDQVVESDANLVVYRLGMSFGRR